jgi:hypothetical protein
MMRDNRRRGEGREEREEKERYGGCCQNLAYCIAACRGIRFLFSTKLGFFFFKNK